MKTIDTLVLPGAGPNLIALASSLKIMVDYKIIQLNKIKKIYGTSAGAILGAIICLKIDLSIAINYLIDRPWNKCIDFNIINMWNLLESKKGLLDSKLIINKALLPLLKSHNIPENITLMEMYKLNPINIDIVTTNMNLFCSEYLNYKSHPDLPLLYALRMSSCLPPVFCPVYYNNNFYIDGGLLDNCAIEKAIIDNKKINKKKKNRNIIVFITSKPDEIDETISFEKFKKMNTIDYGLFILKNSFALLGNKSHKTLKSDQFKKYVNLFIVPVKYYTTERELWVKTTKNKSERLELHDNAAIKAFYFCKKMKNKIEDEYIHEIN